MSAADDVFEMQTLTNALADRLVGIRGREKQRIGAIAKAIGVSANRALEFLKGKARRVDAWEKEHARRELHALEHTERCRRETEYALWLESEIGRFRASGEELDGAAVVGFERVIRDARARAGAVALSSPAESDADFDQSEGWGR